MSRRIDSLGATLACTLLAGAPIMSLGAQRDHVALDSIARVADSASQRYADLRVASASGYRRIGPDFPGMGEHWVHPGLLVSGTIDAEHPTMLVFANVLGKRTLLGVGFVTTTRGDAPATTLPGWPGAWHEHSGLLSDESGVSPGTSAPSDTHVWVLHMWTRLKNPDGQYAADNWALPFVRMGLRPPATTDVDAARALSLLANGAYLRDLLTDAGLRTFASSALVDSLLTTTRSRVDTIAARAASASVAAPSDLAALRDEWSTLVRSLRATLGPDVVRYLAPPHATSSATHPHAPTR